MFGPVLVADAVRTARLGRHLIFRCVILGVLLLVLLVLYVGHFHGLEGLLRPTSLPPNEMARFAQNFFELFMLVQLLAVIVLTPAYTAGAVSEERERKTLDFLLASSLRNHEIVLGKLASRLGSVGMIVLTGLPLLSMLQLLGGVDPDLVLAGYAVTLMSMLSLGCLGVMLSVFSRRSVAAILLTYLLAALYLAVSTVLHLTGVLPTEWDNVACGGNVLVAYWKYDDPTLGGVLGGNLWRITLAFTLFHLAVSLGCLTLAVVPFRAWSMATGSRGQRRSYVVGLSQRRKRLPAVAGTDPMLWKELHAEPMFRLNRPAVVAVSTLITVSLILGSMILVLAIALVVMTAGFTHADVLTRLMNAMTRVLGTVFGSGLLLVIAVRAATCLGGERERQTMDGLLASPLGDRQVLRAKWLGSFLSTRKLWWFLAAVWLVGAVTGGLSLTAIPCVVASWLTFAAFLVSLGLWLSLICKSTMRAVTIMLGVLLALTLGPWLLGAFLDVLSPLLMARTGSENMTMVLGATCCAGVVVISGLVGGHYATRQSRSGWTRLLVLVPILFLTLIISVVGLIVVGMAIDLRWARYLDSLDWRDVLSVAFSPPANLWAMSYSDLDWDRYTENFFGGYSYDQSYLTWLLPALVGPAVYAISAWVLWMATCWRFPFVTGRVRAKARLLPPPTSSIPYP